MDIPEKGNKLILLGEDDIDDQELFAEALLKTDHTYKVVSFANGEDLLIHLHGLSDPELPGIILIDYNLPKKNGSEIITEINQFHRYKTIPKLIWSTSNSPKFRETSLVSGAADYIVKPVYYDNLLHIVRHILSFVNGRDGK
jgi:DNA-binding response OmpR family regulator